LKITPQNPYPSNQIDTNLKKSPQNPYLGSMVVSESERGEREEEKKWLAIMESEPHRRLAIVEAVGLCWRVLGDPAGGVDNLEK
jgi:hypothetical protein